MQADMSSTITQVETLQSYLEQGIEAVMVKDDAILRKQATEKGMVILSQKTLEIYQQRQKVKGADVIIFARLKSDTYIRYALEENCFLERLDCNIYGSSRWLNKYLEGTLEITTQLVAANKLRIDIRNLADIPLILKPIPQTSICLNELEPIELQGSARKVIFASLSDMTLSSYDLNVEVVNLFSTETNMSYVYNIPVKGMLFSKSESGVLNCAIIPQPKTIRSNTHSKFVINEQTCIQVATNKAKTEIHFLTDRLKQAASLTPEIKQFLVPKNNIIVFKELPKNTLGKEGYRLQVTEDSIEIEANEKNGFFYAIQTLLQLLPPEIYSSTTAIERSWEVPAVFIEDTPRFAYRGMHLDVSRHFYPVSFVKKYIDLLAMQKMNYFHWHLTDDQGWRIEIKKYPRLTEIGAFRDSTQMEWYESHHYDGKPHGGFYTQTQIRNIIKYASERHITIIPEIEMPGHSAAAIAAYPWLSATGKEIKVPCNFGVQYDVFNVTDPKVLNFLNDVIDEVTALFSSGILHIGGDEVRYDQWNASSSVQKFIQEKGFSSASDIQVWFTNQMSKVIAQKGWRMMGWNDITGEKLHHFQSGDKEGTERLAPGTIVQFWKGDSDMLQRAAEQGQHIVNSYNNFTYLNYSYEYDSLQATYEFKPISLQRAYEFKPVPENFPVHLVPQILGASCQMWGEWIPTVESMNYHIYPRIGAYAEVFWTLPIQKDYVRFRKSLEYFLTRWKKQGIIYGPTRNNQIHSTQQTNIEFGIPDEYNDPYRYITGTSDKALSIGN